MDLLSILDLAPPFGLGVSAPSVALPVQPNNFVSTAGSARAAGDGTFALATGDGARLAAEIAKIPGAGAISQSQPVRFTAVQKGGYLAGQVIDPAKVAHFQATGLAGDTLTGVTLADGSADLAFRARDVVVFDVQAGHLKALADAIAAAGTGSGSGSGSGSSVTYSPFGASGPSHSTGLVPDPGASAGTTRTLFEDGTWRVPSVAGSIGGLKRFTVPAPSGGDDAPAIQAVHDQLKAWTDPGGTARGVLYFPYYDSGGAYTLDTPIILDASSIEIDGDPGTVIGGACAAYLIGYRRRVAANGQLTARLRTDLAPLVPDGSVAAGTRWAVRSYDPTVEVVGTPPGGATFTLGITLTGSGGGSATTAAIAANADATSVAAAMQAAIRTISGQSGATVTATGGPLGAAPVTYSLGGTLAGFLAPSLSASLSGFGATAYVNCGHKAHSTFDSSPLSVCDPNSPSAPFKHWSDVRTPEIGFAIYADWANVGRQPDGSFLPVSLGGVGNRGHAQNYRFNYSPVGNSFSLDINCSPDFSVGTDFTFRIPINDKAQKFQAVIFKPDLVAGTITAWSWDGTLDGNGRMHMVPQTVTGSTVGLAGATLRDNAAMPFNAACSGSSSVVANEFNGRLDDGYVCGFYVHGSGRFQTGTGGNMVLSSDGVTAPTFDEMFFTGDNNVLGFLTLTDTPGSIWVTGNNRNSAFLGALANEADTTSDATGNVTLNEWPAINCTSTWGHAVSVWHSLGLRMDRPRITGGGWNIGCWETSVSYPVEILSPVLVSGRLGALKLCGTSKFTVERPAVYYPGRFVLLTHQASGKISDMTLAPAGPPQWVWYHCASDIGDINTEFAGAMLDLEGFAPTGGYFLIEPMLGSRGTFTISGCIIPDIIAPARGVWLPQVSNSRPTRFVMRDCNSSTDLARGTVLVQADDPNVSGEVTGTCELLGVANATQPHKYVSGAGAVVAHTRGSALPTQGAFEAGKHIHHNTAPASNGVLYWVCTTSGDYAGTPPKWAPVTLGAEA